MKHLYTVLALGAMLGLSPAAQAQKQRTTDTESGMLEKGKKVGVWEYFSHTRDGRQVLVQRYDHTTNKLVYYRPIEDVPYNIEVTPGQWTRTKVQQPPLYIGGEAILAGYMGRLTYPQLAQDRNIQGKVLITFVIDTLGRASNYKVLNSIGGGCDEEAMKTCQSIPPQWVPARVGSRAVPVMYELPFTFRLQR